MRPGTNKPKTSWDPFFNFMLSLLDIKKNWYSSQTKLISQMTKSFLQFSEEQIKSYDF